MTPAALAPRPRPPQPHRRSFGWSPGDPPPAAFLEATRRWLGPPPTPERLTALEAVDAAKPHREHVTLALVGEPVEPEDLSRGLLWRDWGPTVDPSTWPAHDRHVALIREVLKTPEDERTAAQLAALRSLPARYERLFLAWDIAHAASDGLAATDPEAKPGPDLEAACRRIAGRATSKAVA